MQDVDVVVVGAGLAGLSAARALDAAGLSVRVLEARDRVAGRNHGGFLSSGVPVELGGQWVGPTQDVVLALIDELGLETFETYHEGRSLIAYDDEVVAFDGDDFGLPASSAAEVRRLMGEIDALCSTVHLAGPWETSGAADLDRQTFDQWLVANSDDDLARRFYRLQVPALFSAEPSELSLLHFLFYMKSGTSFGHLMEVAGGAQERRVVGGTHQISERMAEQLGDSVRLEAVVHSIDQRGDEVTVSYDGGAVTGGRVVVAVPPVLAGRLRYQPPLPALRDGLTQQMPAGSVIKFHVAYETPFWREEGLNGLVMGLDDAFGIVLDNSPRDASCGVLVGFIEGAHARAVADLDEEQRARMVIGSLVKYFGSQAAEPTEVVQQDWNAEEFTRGCYGGRFGAGAWTSYGKALSKPVGRIHWAGAETSDVWNGYMDGAIRSGRRAAAEILRDLG